MSVCSGCAFFVPEKKAVVSCSVLVEKSLPSPRVVVTNLSANGSSDNQLNGVLQRRDAMQDELFGTRVNRQHSSQKETRHVHAHAASKSTKKQAVPFRHHSAIKLESSHKKFFDRVETESKFLPSPSMPNELTFVQPFLEKSRPVGRAPDDVRPFALVRHEHRGLWLTNDLSLP